MKKSVGIKEEEPFHTIVVMRTDNPDVANRFPHTIFTDKEDNLVYAPTQEQGFFYNMELDAFKCRWITDKMIVLADFSPLKHVLNKSAISKFSSFKVVDFALLGGQSLSFYLKLSTGKFKEVVPLVVIGNTLVLVFRKGD